MKRFAQGLAVGIAATASFFLLLVENEEAAPAFVSENESAASGPTRIVDAPPPIASVVAVEQNSSALLADGGGAENPSTAESSYARDSQRDTADYSEPQFYLDEYDQELKARVDTVAERLKLSTLQRIELEKKLLSQKSELIGKVGEEFLDHIMIDEFSIGLEEDLTERQVESFHAYKRERAMYAAKISSAALVASIRESTGISDARADELEQALINAHYNNRMADGFTNPFQVIEASLTPEELDAVRTRKP